jgi:hypothetical protein
MLNKQPHCQRCGRAADLNVHHVSYENLGHETDADVVVLCSVCHRLHHSGEILLRIANQASATIRAQHVVTEKEWRARTQGASLKAEGASA